MSFYEDPYFWDGIDESDWILKDDVKKYLDLEHWVEAIIDAVYHTGDIDDLQNAIDELTAPFGLRVPSTKPCLERKRKSA